MSAKATALVDTFDPPALDTTKWTAQLNPFGQGGTTSIDTTGGTLNIHLNNATAVYAQIVSVSSYDITGSYFAVRFTAFGPDATGMERSLIVTSNPATQPDGIQIDAQHTGTGTPNLHATSPTTGAFSGALASNNPVWVRVRETAGTTFAEYSYNFVTWTTIYSEASSTVWKGNQAVQFVVLQFGEDNGTSGTTYTLSFDDFNAPSDERNQHNSQAAVEADKTYYYA